MVSKLRIGVLSKAETLKICIIGIKERIGKMDEKWRDVAMLERRSKIVGID